MCTVLAHAHTPTLTSVLTFSLELVLKFCLSLYVDHRYSAIQFYSELLMISEISSFYCWNDNVFCLCYIHLCSVIPTHYVDALLLGRIIIFSLY